MNLFSENYQYIIDEVKKLFQEINDLDDFSKIEVINKIKLALHEVSPMKMEPVDCVIWVPNESVYANDYNPNSVAPPEMKLLAHSIMEDGYTQPIVSFLNPKETEQANGYRFREVVDGFHRNRVGKEIEEVKKRVKGYLPVVTINQHRQDKADRIASTIRHNRARGKHQVEAMSDIVIELKRRRWSDEKIGIELGMEPDEVTRLAQITGLAEAFKDKDFSEAWEAEIFEDEITFKETED